MYKILEQIKNHPDAWPFLDPVDEDFAPDYYTKISQPMDLEKMEQRVSTKYYQSVNEFMADFDLIVENCKKYNGPESGTFFLPFMLVERVLIDRLHLEYSFMVDSLAEEFRVLTSRYLNSVYERDPVSSDSESDSSTASDESTPRKRKEGVLDAKKRSGLMKIAQHLTQRSAVSNKNSGAVPTKAKLKTDEVWDTPSPDSSETDSKSRPSKSSKLKVPFLNYINDGLFKQLPLKQEKNDKKKGGNNAKLTSNRKPSGGARNVDALALAAATEQSLKVCRSAVHSLARVTLLMYLRFRT